VQQLGDVKMRLAVIVVCTIGIGSTLLLASFHHEAQATPQGANIFVLGKPHGAARVSTAEVIQAIKDQGSAKLFQYASSVTTQFGSWTPNWKLSGQIQQDGDYWTVTLTGLNNDNNGVPLLPSASSPQSAAPPAHTITFVISDLTGQVVTWSQY
jgi:hypothetical protein